MTICSYHFILATLLLVFCGQIANAFQLQRIAKCPTEAHHVPGESISDDISIAAAAESSSGRRSVLFTIFGAGLTTSSFLVPSTAAADDDDLYLAKPMGPKGESRPSAPLEYLLPAARVGVYIYQTLAIVEELARLQSSSSDADAKKAADDIAKLDALLLSPPSFIKAADPKQKRGDPYGSTIPIVGEIGVAAQKQKERKERSIDVGALPQFFELGELVGERSQWNRLQSAEKAREGASEVRRAFNIYTTNLNFNPNKYEWKGSREEKSKMIRDDKLPSATKVIASDLDARDLYRNQVQTALDDARAEYEYQKKESGVDISKFDASELLGLLKGAQVAVDKWFSFIADSDVQAALEAVRKEQTQ